MRALARTRGTEAQATVYIENYDLTSNEKLIWILDVAFGWGYGRIFELLVLLLTLRQQ